MQGTVSECYDLVVDTGAGSGYLIWPQHRACTWKTVKCCMTVRVADGSLVQINRKISCEIRIGQRIFTVWLYVLPSTVEVPYVLCGRALIELFDLVIQGCSRVVTREGVCLFGDSDEVYAASSVPCDSPNVPCLFDDSDEVYAASSVPCDSPSTTVHLPWCSSPLPTSSEECFCVLPPLEPVIEENPSELDLSAVSPTTDSNLECASVCNLPLSAPDIESIQEPASSAPAVHEDHVLSCSLPVDSHCVSSMIRPTEVSESESASVIMPPHASALPVISNLLNDLCSKGRVPLVYCPTGFLSLRAIDPGGPRDLPDQTHQFVLELPENKPSPSGGYSAILYRKLLEDQRTQFDALVQEYIEAGWWEPLPPDDSRSIHATDVFMHKPGTPKARLVCDFRKFNSLFRDVSSVMPLLDHLLLLVRTEPVDNVCVGDCSKAFYRVRLDPPLPLRAGLNTYLCNRVSFGLSMGPEALRSSLGSLFKLWGQMLAKGDGFLPFFVDDFVFMGSGKHFSHDLSSFVTLLRRCGFAISKSKWQPSFPLTLFNRRLERSSSTVSTCCPDQRERSEKLLQRMRESPTKRLAFELAGVLGYDPVKAHPFHRLTADVLRHICGRAKTWDGPLEPSTPLNSLIEWISELNFGPCVHPFSQKPLYSIELYADASIYGYGYVVLLNGQKIIEQAGSWSGTEFSYHTNRLEGIALMRGMRAVANYLEFRESVRFGNPALKPSIAVRTDSKSAVAWALGRPPTNASHSLEFRMLTRLSTALTGEVEVLRSLSAPAQFLLSHAPGISNIADSLSRGLYKNNIGSLLRTKTAITDKIEVAESLSLVESIATESFDLDDFLTRFEFYLEVFDSFRPSGASEREQVLDRLVRATQINLDSRRKNLYVLKNGIYFHEWVDIAGNLQSKPVIPQECGRVRELMLRAFHRMNGHRGSQFDLSYLFERSPYFFEKALPACKNTVRRCLVCAIRKARPAQVCAANVVPRKFDLPPFSRIACDLFYVTRSEPICSFMCIDTGVVSFIPIPDGKMDSLLTALRAVSNRYCVSFKRILWDNAPAFVSEKMHQKLRLEGHPDVEFVFTPVDGSSMNPVERMHRECWSILRSRGFAKNLKKGEWRNCLDEVACIINQRPIGHLGESVLTPARLAFGSAHGPTGDQIYAVRKYFYEQLFLTRRRRHTPRQRRALLTLGSLVLVHVNPTSKLDLPFKIGRIVDVMPGYLMIKSGQTTSRVATANVAPLDAFFQDENSPGDRVVEN